MLAQRENKDASHCPNICKAPKLHHSASDRKREEEKGVVGKEINRIRTYFLTD